MDVMDRLRATVADLEDQLREAEEHVAKLKRAIAAVKDVLPLEAHGVVRVAGSASLDGGPAPASGTQSPNGSGEPPRRPYLRDSIPQVLRESWPHGATLSELALDMWKRKLLGGDDEPSVETLRQALTTLRGKGVLTSSVPEGDKAAVWRLSNQTLTQAPAFSLEEQEQGI